MTTPSKSSMLPVYIVLGLFLAVALVFLVAFVYSTEVEVSELATGTLVLHPDTYMNEVTSALQGADAARGAEWVKTYACESCHVVGGGQTAPPFAGIADRAQTRRPPLTAMAYLYESITQPNAYHVEGFSAVMPQNYPERLSPREIGDIIAYLLTQ